MSLNVTKTSKAHLHSRRHQAFEVKLVRNGGGGCDGDDDDGGGGGGGDDDDGDDDDDDDGDDDDDDVSVSSVGVSV